MSAPPDRRRSHRPNPFGCNVGPPSTGTVMVARQTVALGRGHAGKTVTIDVTDTDLVVDCDDGPRTVRRTNHTADP